jgi:adenylylsulfate kinase
VKPDTCNLKRDPNGLRSDTCNDEGVVVWFTGLSAAGKSTLAEALAKSVRTRGRKVEILDGDEVREHLSRGLGFSREDRDTHVMRMAFVARLLSRHGVFVVVAAISPFREARDKARATIKNFFEIHVSTPLLECIKRDPKGLYSKAMTGDLPRFTGISDPYEEPLAAELTLDTRVSVEDSVARILSGLREKGYPCSR